MPSNTDTESGQNAGRKFWRPFNKPLRCRKPLSRIVAVASIFVVVCEFLYVIYATSKGPNYLVHQQSDGDAFWEKFCVILESILVMPFVIFMAMVFFLSTRLHCWSFTIIIFILLLSIGYNFMWILDESVHMNLTSTENLKDQIRINLKENFEKQGFGILPAWLHKLQLEGQCCGIDGPSDWQLLWEVHGLPKSCCFPNNSSDLNVISCEIVNGSHYTDGCLYAPKKLNRNDVFWLLGLKMYKIIFIILLLLCMCLAPDMVLTFMRNVVNDLEDQAQVESPPPASPPVEINDDEFVDRLIQIQRTEDHDEALKMSLKLPLHSAKARFSQNNDLNNNNYYPIPTSPFSSQFSIQQNN